MEVTAKRKIDVDGQKVGKTVTAEYDFGNDLADAVAKHSEEIVFSNYRANGKVTIQALIGRNIEAKVSDENIKDVVAKYKLGAPTERAAKDPTKDIIALWPGMSEEERQNFLKKLKESD